MKFIQSLLLLLSFLSPAFSQTPLTLADRIAAQEKIEQVYYSHRVWPNASPKPPFEEMISRSVIEKKVNDSLSVRITKEMLQAEMDRIAKTTKDPAMLQELFSALNNDPFLIAETVVRPIVAQQMIHGEKFVSSKRRIKKFRLPLIKTDASCGGWDVLDASNPPSPRSHHAAIWTGTEMIVWGGSAGNTGGRYDPALNTWTPTSTGPNCPPGGKAAVWTGTEMIVWGGVSDISGGRYNPTTDSWLATSLINAPESRKRFTAVWTGSEMIIWGGEITSEDQLNTGGRYDPLTDTWQPTSIGTNVPEPRSDHSAVWTGQEMIVWGGRSVIYALNSGAKYDPISDSWVPTSSAPVALFEHTVVWTGNQMIIWGGRTFLDCCSPSSKGAVYDPTGDEWHPTSLAGASTKRAEHTAIWTGETAENPQPRPFSKEMIVWGGGGGEYGDSSAGGRYSPATDSWLGTAVGPNTPAAREDHTAVWTGTKMIIFGGWTEGACLPNGALQTNDLGDSGGIYSPEADNIVIDPPVLPSPQANATYSETISASGGVPPYTFSNDNCLPAGLTLDESSGVISGIPQIEGEGAIFAITATDANSCPGSRGYFMRFCVEIIFSPLSLPVGLVGRPYNQTISVSGVVAPSSFYITAGALPDGLTLDAPTGVISGTPTSGGTFDFTITVIDKLNCAKSHDYTINVLSTHS